MFSPTRVLFWTLVIVPSKPSVNDRGEGEFSVNDRGEGECWLTEVEFTHDHFNLEIVTCVINTSENGCRAICKYEMPFSSFYQTI